MNGSIGFLFEQDHQNLSSMPGSAELEGLIEFPSFSKEIGKYVNIDLEPNLRDFLYSPAGIAAIAGIDYMGGAPLSMLLFAILVAYDVKKWIDLGEPNWLFLITDLICIGTAGFANSIATPLIKVAKNIKFKTLTSFFQFIQKNFKSLWQNFILPMTKSIGGVINKVISLITKIKPSLSKSNKLSSSISNITSYLLKLSDIIEESLKKVIGGAGLVAGKTYAKYKTTSTASSQIAQTDTGKKILKKAFPNINPLLGSHKSDPFLMNLITLTPQNVNTNTYEYKIHPIFADNSKDTF